MLDRPVVANNTPLVALFQVGRLILLRDIFGEVLIPEAVRDEFLAIDRAEREVALAASPWLKSAAVQSQRRTLAYSGLDRGESEVLALAEERNARLVVIDDWKARQYARRLGFQLTGTLGILLLAKDKGLIEGVAETLRELQVNGLRLGRDLVASALKTAGEG